MASSWAVGDVVIAAGMVLTSSRFVSSVALSDSCCNSIITRLSWGSSEWILVSTEVLLLLLLVALTESIRHLGITTVNVVITLTAAG